MLNFYASETTELILLNNASNALGLYILPNPSQMSGFSFTPSSQQFSPPGSQPPNHPPYQAPTNTRQLRATSFHNPPDTPTPSSAWPDPRSYQQAPPGPYDFTLPDPSYTLSEPRGNTSFGDRSMAPTPAGNNELSLDPPRLDRQVQPTKLSMFVDAVANEFGFGVAGEGNMYRESLHGFALVSFLIYGLILSLPRVHL